MRHNFAVLKRLGGFLMGMATALALVGLAACSGGQSQANLADTNYMDQQTAILTRGQPLHLYDYSQDRASFIAIYDARVQGKATYSAAVPDIGGTPWWQCPSRGYPIPATTQLTNPERVTSAYAGSSVWIPIPQAEPNGTFSGPTDGTYMQCVDTDGSLYTVYSEPKVMTWPFPVVWKGDHFEKANPNERASFALPTPPQSTSAPANFAPTTNPTPTR